METNVFCLSFCVSIISYIENFCRSLGSPNCKALPYLALPPRSAVNKELSINDVNAVLFAKCFCKKFAINIIFLVSGSCLVSYWIAGIRSYYQTDGVRLNITKTRPRPDSQSIGTSPEFRFGIMDWVCTLGLKHMLDFFCHKNSDHAKYSL